MIFFSHGGGPFSLFLLVSLTASPFFLNILIRCVLFFNKQGIPLVFLKKILLLLFLSYSSENEGSYMTDQLLQNPTLDSVGKILKEARETQGIVLEEVAKILCISKRQLIKLESDHESLVCDVYNVGFLRSYAKLLNLNENGLIQKFKDQTTSFPSSHLVFPTPLSKKGMPSFRIIAVSLLALVSVIIGYEWLRTRNTLSFKQEIPLPTKTSVNLAIPSPPSQEFKPESNVAEAVAPPPEVIQSDLPEILPVSVTEEVSPKPLVDFSASLPSQPTLLKVTEDSWVEVKDDQGNTIVSRLFHPEETYQFDNSQNLLLKTGNARGIHLMSGEKQLTFPGNQGEVKSGISLNPEKWVD